jgi:hypothetical protein
MVKRDQQKLTNTYILDRRSTTHDQEDAMQSYYAMERFNSLFVRLVDDGWCWFVLREKYCWLVGDGWFVLR